MIIYESSYYGVVPLGDYVEHVGVKGTHWGVRRWQNEDGSLTPAGREHYGYGKRGDHKEAKFMKKAARRNAKLNKWKTNETRKLDKRYDKRLSKLERKTEKQAAKYEREATKAKASQRKLNKIANRYEKANRKQLERAASKREELKKVQTASIRDMKREKRRVRRKALVGYNLYGANVGGLVWQAARRGKYKEKVRINRSTRRQINRESKASARYSREALQKRYRR